MRTILRILRNIKFENAMNQFGRWNIDLTNEDYSDSCGEYIVSKLQFHDTQYSKGIDDNKKLKS